MKLNSVKDKIKNRDQIWEQGGDTQIYIWVSRDTQIWEREVVERVGRQIRNQVRDQVGIHVKRLVMVQVSIQISKFLFESIIKSSNRLT